MNILDEIIAYKKEEVELRKAAKPLEVLAGEIAGMEKCRNFYKAVTKRNRKHGINIIAEVKNASPSAGVIRADFDPVKIAKIYESCHADAVSVLTDEKWFKGKLEYLTAVKEAVAVPVLRKDFIVDAYQIYEARAAGADAVLLIAEALNLGQLSDLMIMAGELSLTVLLEVHSADTLLKVRSLIGFPKKGYSVLGINNRDLSSMEVDINTTGRLAELADGKVPIVAESGIRTADDVRKLRKVGVRAVLIGQTLCQSADIEAKFHELF